MFTYYTNKNHKERNWDCFLEGIFFNKFKGNLHTTYGTESEEPAKRLYCNRTGYTIINCGLIIPVDYPWLGFSPDGFAFNPRNGSIKLIEVKAPKAGRSMPASFAMCRQVSQLLVKGNKVTLKCRSTWYGQIQLGLLICQLQQCDLIIYSSYENKETGQNGSFVVIPVLFNCTFALELLEKLTSAYFDLTLPFLIKNQSRLSKIIVNNE